MCNHRKLRLQVAALLLGCLAAALFALALRPLSRRELLLASSAAALRLGETMEREVLSGQVNVNTADLEALCTLTGVGPVLAERMIQERQENGEFFYPEDLLAVKGIGQKTLNRLMGQFCLD